MSPDSSARGVREDEALSRIAEIVGLSGHRVWACAGQSAIATCTAGIAACVSQFLPNDGRLDELFSRLADVVAGRLSLPSGFCDGRQGRSRAACCKACCR